MNYPAFSIDGVRFKQCDGLWLQLLSAAESIGEVTLRPVDKIDQKKGDRLYRDLFTRAQNELVTQHIFDIICMYL